MYDPRFMQGSGSSRPGFHTPYPRSRYAASLEELYPLWQADVDLAEALAGRRLSDKELREGVVHQDARNSQQRKRDKFNKARELNPPAVDNRTPAQLREAAALSRLDEERLAAMSPAEREATVAQREREADDARLAEEARRAEIRQTPGYQRLRQRLDDQIFAAKFNPTAGQQFLEELQHQSSMLEKLDVETVRSNLDQLQRVARGELDGEKLRLKASADALAQREKMLADGLTFDDVRVVMVGNTEYVSLTKGDAPPVKITRERFDRRESDETLAAILFPESGDANDNQ